MNIFDNTIKNLIESNNIEFAKQLDTSNIDTIYQLTMNNSTMNNSPIGKNNVVQTGGKLVSDHQLKNALIYHAVFHGKLSEDKILTIPTNVFLILPVCCGFTVMDTIEETQFFTKSESELLEIINNCKNILTIGRKNFVILRPGDQYCDLALSINLDPLVDEGLYEQYQKANRHPITFFDFNLDKITAEDIHLVELFNENIKKKLKSSHEKNKDEVNQLNKSNELNKLKDYEQMTNFVNAKHFNEILLRDEKIDLIYNYVSDGLNEKLFSEYMKILRDEANKLIMSNDDPSNLQNKVNSLKMEILSKPIDGKFNKKTLDNIFKHIKNLELLLLEYINKNSVAVLQATLNKHNERDIGSNIPITIPITIPMQNLTTLQMTKQRFIDFDLATVTNSIIATEMEKIKNRQINYNNLLFGLAYRNEKSINFVRVIDGEYMEIYKMTDQDLLNTINDNIFFELSVNLIKELSYIITITKMESEEKIFIKETLEHALQNNSSHDFYLSDIINHISNLNKSKTKFVFNKSCQGMPNNEEHEICHINMCLNLISKKLNLHDTLSNNDVFLFNQKNTSKLTNVVLFFDENRIIKDHKYYTVIDDHRDVYFYCVCIFNSINITRPDLLAKAFIYYINKKYPYLFDYVKYTKSQRHQFLEIWESAQIKIVIAVVNLFISNVYNLLLKKDDIASATKIKNLME